MKLKIAFIGFGKSTTRYHLPYVLIRENMEVVSIFNRSKKPELEKNYNNYNINFTDNLEEVLNNKEINLVSICSPLHTHYEYAKKCLEAGKNVLVEKPFMSSVKEAEELFKLAKEKELTIMPYQNRRFDSDFLLLRGVLENIDLGEIVEVESHFDRFRPDEEMKPGAATDGQLWGLGSHTIDQIVSIFGKPHKIYFDVRNIENKDLPDNYYHVELFYENFKTIIKFSNLVMLEYPKFIIQGKKGSFIKYGIDKQEDFLKAGIMPGQDGFGEDSEENDGIVAYLDNEGNSQEEIIQTPLGDYGRIYDNLYDVIINKQEKIVKDEEVLTVLKILELGIQPGNPKVIDSFT